MNRRLLPAEAVAVLACAAGDDASPAARASLPRLARVDTFQITPPPGLPICHLRWHRPLTAQEPHVLSLVRSGAAKLVEVSDAMVRRYIEEHRDRFGAGLLIPGQVAKVWTLAAPRLEPALPGCAGGTSPSSPSTRRNSSPSYPA